MASTPAEGGTPDPQFANSAADGGAADGDSAAEPPLKRARSSSGAMDTMGGGEGTPGLGERCLLVSTMLHLLLCCSLHQQDTTGGGEGMPGLGERCLLLAS
jgi:hypothetical protein